MFEGKPRHTSTFSAYTLSWLSLYQLWSGGWITALTELLPNYLVVLMNIEVLRLLR